MSQLMEPTDDAAAERWVAQELPKSSGPCDHSPGFPEQGWDYDALGYNRRGNGAVRGVTICNAERMLGWRHHVGGARRTLYVLECSRDSSLVYRFVVSRSGLSPLVDGSKSGLNLNDSGPESFVEFLA
jgi:hypothetical protein